MRYHIPTLGIVRGAFRLGDIQYPANWLALATDAERAAIGAVPEPTAGPGQIVAHDPIAGWILRNLTAEETAQRSAAEHAGRIARAWAEADILALTGADHNSRARYLAWLVDPACPALRRERILAVQAWMDQVWLHYAATKAAIESGDETAIFDPSTVGPCPFGFWDIAGA
jgi:hypothetical protein